MHRSYFRARQCNRENNVAIAKSETTWHNTAHREESQPVVTMAPNTSPARFVAKASESNNARTSATD
jgi:hypothetical protein